jgi:hypothetical protein
VHEIAAPDAHGAHRPRDELRPGADVGGRVSSDRWTARRARRGVYPHQPFARHGEHPERVVFAQVVLQRERESSEIGEFPEVARMHAGGVESRAIVRDVRVGVPEQAAQPVELKRRKLVS